MGAMSGNITDLRYNTGEMATLVEPDLPETLIEPGNRSLSLDLGPTWEYRQLLLFLTWRDLKVRYKQTVLGAGWAILQPLLATVIFAVFFGRVAHLSSEGVPYLFFAFAGTLPWTYFANAMTNGSNSLVAAAAMITKVYFPRMALPVSTVLGSAVDFLCAALLLVPMMIWYRETPSLRLLALPGFFLLATGIATGMALFLSALNVRYRDVKYVIPFLTQMWMFATPVVYSAMQLGQPWKTLYALNPMVAVVEGFRWSIIGTGGLTAGTLIVSVATTIGLLLIGALYLRHVDQSMADVI
jgi:lipopolysaccharide transport system permease protein